MCSLRRGGDGFGGGAGEELRGSDTQKIDIRVLKSYLDILKIYLMRVKKIIN